MVSSLRNPLAARATSARTSVSLATSVFWKTALTFGVSSSHRESIRSHHLSELTDFWYARPRNTPIPSMPLIFLSGADSCRSVSLSAEEPISFLYSIVSFYCSPSAFRQEAIATSGTNQMMRLP
jgi:hypothetical protein